MIYHFTPIVAAGIIDMDSVESYEIYLLRKVLGISNDIKGQVIRNVNDNYKRSTREVI